MEPLSTPSPPRSPRDEEKAIFELSNQMDQLAMDSYHPCSDEAEQWLERVVEYIRKRSLALEPKGTDITVDPYPLRRMISHLCSSDFNGKSEQDPADWLREVFNCLSTSYTWKQFDERFPIHPLISALFRVEKEFASTESDWMLSLRPPQHFLTTVTEASQTTSQQQITVTDLINHAFRPEVVSTGCPAREKATSVQKLWYGLARLPEHLILRFDRTPFSNKISVSGTNKLGYHVAVEPELDLAILAGGIEKRSLYKIRTVIQHRGSTMDSGHYFAFTHNDEAVRLIRAGTSSYTRRVSAETSYLAFYERIGDWGHRLFCKTLFRNAQRWDEYLGDCSSTG
ncbi:hypothetical protein BDV95DRAFT_589826 [Massariosphaeria phaeospora]|uniref:USP domain-containing protein n=1 Tax=Massariosphaeria phaeospora TaxID=100035 RepID=A0A7C8IIF4_9PLEO|nr:hypothetical protein BDV95DRAFT_589826 [Massariosphaeria phaeospora]